MRSQRGAFLCSHGGGNDGARGLLEEASARICEDGTLPLKTVTVGVHEGRLRMCPGHAT